MTGEPPPLDPTHPRRHPRHLKGAPARLHRFQPEQGNLPRVQAQCGTRSVSAVRDRQAEPLEALERAKKGPPYPRTPGRHGLFWRHVGPPLIVAHQHVDLEFNLVMSGSAAYFVERVRFPLYRHTLTWIRPGQRHMMLEGSMDLTVWVAHFMPGILPRGAARKSLQALFDNGAAPGTWSRQIDDSDAAELDRQMRRLGDQRDDRDLYNAGLRYLLLSAWSAYVRAAENDRGLTGMLHPAVDRAATLLCEDPSLSVEELAPRVGLSAGRLSRLFGEQMRVTLVEYRNQVRLQRFLDAYGSGKRRGVLECALDAGFNSYTTFHRVFTKHMGTSPRALAQRAKC